MSETTYVSVPTEVEAIQWTGKNTQQIKAWMVSCMHREGSEPPKIALFVKRRQSGMSKTLFTNLIEDAAEDITAALWVEANGAYLGIEDTEWIIKDSLGFYPCKHEMFVAKYNKKNLGVKG